MLKPWVVEDSRITYADRWLKVRTDRCVSPSGPVIDPFHVLEYPAWVNVVALTPDGEIVLVRQYRHGVQQILLELPAVGRLADRFRLLRRSRLGGRKLGQ